MEVNPEILYRAVEAAHHGVYVTDDQGVIEYVNAAFSAITGYSQEELIGSRISILSSGETPAEYYRRMWETIREGTRWQEETTNRRKDGSLYSAFQIISPITDGTGKPARYVGIQHDVTEQKRVRDDLADALFEFNAIFSHTQDAVFLVDVEERPGAPVEHKAFRYRKLSATHERLTGLSSDGVRGKTPAEVVGPEQGAELVARYQNCVNLRHPTSYEETLDLPSGRRVWHTQLTPIIRGDTVVQIVGSARDITERKEMEENLRYLSEVDSLTGVPNRRKTTEELDRELARAQRHGHPLSILLADIDHFKAVNDELGHETGDTALRGVAATIQATLRPTDRVGRWGGEEFVVVLPETDRAGARTAAERIRQAVEISQAVPGRTVTVSIGIAALGPIRSANPRALSHTVDSLVRIADEELYRAKERGRNCCSG